MFLNKSDIFISPGFGSHQKNAQDRMKALTDHFLFINKKLVLVLDIDHTILHTTKNPHAVEAFKKSEISSDIFLISLIPATSSPDITYYVKLRPGLREFLNSLREEYFFVIYTKGIRIYAEKILAIIDPDNSLVGERIVSREDQANINDLKTIKTLFPCSEKSVLILDDRANIWQNKRNVFQCHKFHFWPADHATTDDPDPILDEYIRKQNEILSLGERPLDDKFSVELMSARNRDNMLKVTGNVLRSVYTLYYQNTPKIPPELPADAPELLSRLRKEILRGCHLVFSGLFPLDAPCTEQHVWRLASELGAHCSEAVTEEATHLVARKCNTEKASKAALLPNAHIVNVAWLFSCAVHFRRVSEKRFQFGADTRPAEKHVRPYSKNSLSIKSLLRPFKRVGLDDGSDEKLVGNVQNRPKEAKIVQKASFLEENANLGEKEPKPADLAPNLPNFAKKVLPKITKISKSDENVPKRVKITQIRPTLQNAAEKEKEIAKNIKIIKKPFIPQNYPNSQMLPKQPNFAYKFEKTPKIPKRPKDPRLAARALSTTANAMRPMQNLPFNRNLPHFRRLQNLDKTQNLAFLANSRNSNRGFFAAQRRQPLENVHMRPFLKPAPLWGPGSRPTGRRFFRGKGFLQNPRMQANPLRIEPHRPEIAKFQHLPEKTADGSTKKEICKEVIEQKTAIHTPSKKKDEKTDGWSYYGLLFDPDQNPLKSFKKPVSQSRKIPEKATRTPPSAPPSFIGRQHKDWPKNPTSYITTQHSVFLRKNIEAAVLDVIRKTPLKKPPKPPASRLPNKRTPKSKAPGGFDDLLSEHMTDLQMNGAKNVIPSDAKPPPPKTFTPPSKELKHNVDARQSSDANRFNRKKENSSLEEGELLDDPPETEKASRPTHTEVL